MPDIPVRKHIKLYHAEYKAAKMAMTSAIVAKYTHVYLSIWDNSFRSKILQSEYINCFLACYLHMHFYLQKGKRRECERVFFQGSR